MHGDLSLIGPSEESSVHHSIAAGLSRHQGTRHSKVLFGIDQNSLRCYALACEENMLDALSSTGLLFFWLAKTVPKSVMVDSLELSVKSMPHDAVDAAMLSCD